MLKNYFISALRTVQRQQACSIINILSLCIPLVCHVLMFPGAHGESMVATASAAEKSAKDSKIQLVITIDDLPWGGALPDSDTASQAVERIAAVLNKASDMSVSELAQRELLSPLEGELVYWRVDAQYLELGGNDAYLRPRDLIKLGELYRMGGSFKGREILPSEFVRASVATQIMPETKMINHNTLPVRGYGYLWWLLELNGENVYAALGHEGPQSRQSTIFSTSWNPNKSSISSAFLRAALRSSCPSCFSLGYGRSTMDKIPCSPTT